MATELQKEVTTPQKESSTCWQQCQLPESQTSGRWLPRLGHTVPAPALARTLSGWKMQRLTWVGRAYV